MESLIRHDADPAAQAFESVVERSNILELEDMVDWMSRLVLVVWLYTEVTDCLVHKL